MQEINKTILLQYEDACDMMELTRMSCGCCNNDEFVDWYEKNEAYIFRNGMFVIENLMTDSDNNFLKLAFSFILDESNKPSFTIYNYYNQKPVCDFKYIREQSNPYEPLVIINRYDRKLMDSLSGEYGNEELEQSLNKMWNEFEKKKRHFTKEKQYNNLLKQYNEKGRRMEHDFMCSHIVKMFYASMYYFSLKRPDKVDSQEYEKQKEQERDIEVTFKKVKRKYYYTGYINLSHTKIYRVNTKELKEKREFQRHVEKWDVRGHYRNINGKKVWVKPHVKGQGTLENRVYGVQDESEVNVRPKVFEVEAMVPETCSVPEKQFDQYKKEFDESFSKVEPKEFREKMESLGYEFEVRTEPVTNPINIEIPKPPQHKNWFARFVEWIVKQFKK